MKSHNRVADLGRTWMLLGVGLLAYLGLTSSSNSDIQVTYAQSQALALIIEVPKQIISDIHFSEVWKNARRTQKFLNSEPGNPYPVDHHVGTDYVIGKGYGENVSSIIDGTVRYVQNSCAPTNSKTCGLGYGNMIVIQNDIVQVRYAHGFDARVKQGETVKAGQTIQRQSTSGWSDGTHVHLECRAYGLYVDCSNYLEKKDQYISAAIKSCELFIGDREHYKTKEKPREHCGEFLEIAGRANQNFFEIIALGHAETAWCTNTKAKIPDNNCYGWAVYGAMNDPRMYCGSWASCFSKVVDNFKILEENDRFFISQKLGKYTPGNINNHSNNINWGVKQMLKTYKNNLKV